MEGGLPPPFTHHRLLSSDRALLFQVGERKRLYGDPCIEPPEGKEGGRQNLPPSSLPCLWTQGRCSQPRWVSSSESLRHMGGDLLLSHSYFRWNRLTLQPLEAASYPSAEGLSCLGYSVLNIPKSSLLLSGSVSLLVYLTFSIT